MGSIGIMLYYGGKWTSNEEYKDFSAIGIMVPCESSYNQFLELIYPEIEVDKGKVQLRLKYKIEADGPFVKIVSDATLKYYLEAKKNEPRIGKYPIYVDSNEIEVGRIVPQELPGPLSFPTGSHIVETSTDNGVISLLPTLPTLEQLGEQIINIPTIQADQETHGFAGVVTQIDATKVTKGTIFKDKDTLTLSVCMHAIKESYQFMTEKSDSKEYRIECLDRKCKWKLRAAAIRNTNMYEIRKIDSNHNCSIDLLLGSHRNATVNLIAHCIKCKFTATRTIYTPSDIRDDMLRLYGLRIGYQKAWRARELALEMIRGDPIESYRNLPCYLHMLQVSNAGTVTKILMDDNDRFLYCYVALGPSISGWKHCRPVIVVDATYLTGDYGGTLFTACTQDANGSIFILAFGVGDNENDKSWNWFLMQLRESYGERDDLCIVSDRHRSIDKMTNIVYKKASHVACSFHLYKNLKLECRREAKKVKEHFNAAVRAYTINEFNMHMSHIQAISSKAAKYLIDAGVEKWSRAHSKVNRYSTMTSNIVESVNAATKAAKNYPIEALLESLRGMVQKWFHTNLNNANFMLTTLCTRHECTLREYTNESMRLKVIPSTCDIYQVVDGTIAYIVKLDEKSCSCRRFDIEEIPCKHAIAVINENHMSVYDYCSPYLRVTAYKAAYAGTVFPVGNRDEWVMPNNIKSMRVLPPNPKKGPGRPREKRYRSVVEGKPVSHCGRCGAHGHTMKKCKNNLAPRKKQKRGTNQIVQNVPPQN